jgi:hypothetical protein
MTKILRVSGVYRALGKDPKGLKGISEMSMEEWALVLDDYDAERRAATRASVLTKLSQSGTSSLRVMFAQA